MSRLPVRTSSEVIGYTQKLISYEQGSTNNRLLLSGKQTHRQIGNISDSHYFCEQLYNDYVLPFWNGEKYCLYDTGYELPDSASCYISDENLFSEIDRGYNIIFERSHGNEDKWMLVDTESAVGNYTVQHGAGQANTKGTVIVTSACITNAFARIGEMFNTDPCLSESLLRNSNGGALAYFGSSSFGFVHPTSNNLYYSDLINAHFFSNLYVPKTDESEYCFGAVATSAKTDFIEEVATDAIYRWLMFSINSMGDPEMQVYTDTPKKFSRLVSQFPATYIKPEILVGTNSIMVSSTAPGCRIVISDENNQRYVFNNTSIAQLANIPSGTYSVSITKHNYAPIIELSPRLEMAVLLDRYYFKQLALVPILSMFLLSLMRRSTTMSAIFQKVTYTTGHYVSSVLLQDKLYYQKM